MMKKLLFNIKFTVTLLFCLLLVSCASPLHFTNSPLLTYDKDTEYSVEENSEGFALTVSYARYQFIPESGALAIACKSAFTSIAWEVAETKNRKIQHVNEQRIKISMGRNGLTGITSCRAYGLAEWIK